MSAPKQTLSWQLHPSRELVRLAWPITVSMLSFSMMSLVDALIVGHLGAAALAGVGFGTVTTFMLLCFPLGILRAAKTLVSQAIGAGRPGDAVFHRGAVLATALVSGLLAILVVFLAMPLVPALVSAEAVGAATGYLGIRVLGAPAVLVYRALRETLYAEGDTRTPMVATVAANVVNAALALVLVRVFGLGVEGAAAATVVAHALEAGVLVVAQYRRGKLAAMPRREDLRALWRLGLPSGAQYVLEVGSFFLLTLMLQGISHVEAAAHQVALQVNHVAFLPAFALSEAASVLVGQAVGAGRDDLVSAIARRTVALAAAWTGTCAVVLVVFARFVASAFVSTDDVSAAALVTAAVPLMWIQGVFLVFDAFNVVARGVLGGTGDVRYSAVVGICTAWAMTPPLTWLLGVRAGFGAAGGWIGLCLEIMIGATILRRRVQTGGWRAAAEESRRRLATQAAPAGSIGEAA